MQKVLLRSCNSEKRVGQQVQQKNYLRKSARWQILKEPTQQIQMQTIVENWSQEQI